VISGLQECLHYEMSVFVCVSERERECVCMCVCQRERESVCVCVCVRERERVCVGLGVSVRVIVLRPLRPLNKAEVK